MLDFRDIAKGFLILVSKDLNKYTTKKGYVKVGKDNVTLFTPSHIQFAKYGRGAGKMPPLDSILEWVKSKGIVKSDKEARGTAFAIAKSISKKGTKNYVPNAPNAIEEAIDERIKEYHKNLSKAFADELEKELLKTYRKAIPKVIGKNKYSSH